MAIKKYTANADTTITNAFNSNLTTRGTGSNMGASDVLEVFSIYGQQASSSAELSICSTETTKLSLVVRVLFSTTSRRMKRSFTVTTVPSPK